MSLAGPRQCHLSLAMGGRHLLQPNSTGLFFSSPCCFCMGLELPLAAVSGGCNQQEIGGGGDSVDVAASGLEAPRANVWNCARRMG